MSLPQSIVRAPRRSALSVSLVMGLGISLGVVAGVQAAAIKEAASPFKIRSVAPANKAARPQGPGPTAITHTVTTCADDDSPGSLRAIIADANTGDGDTIDMSQLMCSTITLDENLHAPSYIKITQPSLYLLGPGSTQLTISAGAHSSVLRHEGYGTIDIHDVTIANGKYGSDVRPFGGCIYSKGNVTLGNARVEHCEALGTSSTAPSGGALFVNGDLTLYHSSVIDGKAVSGFGTGGKAYGGGAYVHGNLYANYSTIGGNFTLADTTGSGGGMVVSGPTSEIKNSTISGNKADLTGGLFFSAQGGTTEISNSTISGNEATVLGGALYATGDLKLTNSTVVFNHDHFIGSTYAGVNVGGTSFVLESSIVAGNSGASGPADIWGAPNTIVTGGHNLVIAASGISKPADTISECPKLDLLADNGGSTLTHAIMPTSPAVDKGDSQGLIFDQTGHVRTEGIAADIGAFEWRDGTREERIFVSGFDGLCDQ